MALTWRMTERSCRDLSSPNSSRYTNVCNKSTSFYFFLQCSPAVLTGGCFTSSCSVPQLYSLGGVLLLLVVFPSCTHWGLFYFLQCSLAVLTGGCFTSCSVPQLCSLGVILLLVVFPSCTHWGSFYFFLQRSPAVLTGGCFTSFCSVLYSLGVTQYLQLYTDKVIPQGERTAHATIFDYSATWAATCHLWRTQFHSEERMLLCRDLIMAEDSPHRTMQCNILMQLWCFLRVVTGLYVLSTCNVSSWDDWYYRGIFVNFVIDGTFTWFSQSQHPKIYDSRAGEAPTSYLISESYSRLLKSFYFEVQIDTRHAQYNSLSFHGATNLQSHFMQNDKLCKGHTKKYEIYNNTVRCGDFVAQQNNNHAL